MKRSFIPLAGLFLLSACTSSPNNPKGDSMPPTLSTDSVQVLHGQLIMGHEAYSFTADGDTTAYWVIDKSGNLKNLYEAALPSTANPYTSVPAKLKVILKGPSSEGFAAEYDGVIEVLKILSVGK